jgi:hypothetical protein
MTVYNLIATDRPQPAPKRAARQHRFCRDCVHHVETRVMFVVPDHLCGHPSVAHPVTRQPLLRCDDMRHAKGKCGERAKLFEAVDLIRMSEPPRLLNGARIRELFARHIAEARA